MPRLLHDDASVLAGLQTLTLAHSGIVAVAAVATILVSACVGSSVAMPFAALSAAAALMMFQWGERWLRTMIEARLADADARVEAALAERDARGAVIACLRSGLGRLAAGDHPHRLTTCFPPAYQGLRLDFNKAATAFAATRVSLGRMATAASSVHSILRDLHRRDEAHPDLSSFIRSLQKTTQDANQAEAMAREMLVDLALCHGVVGTHGGAQFSGTLLRVMEHGEHVASLAGALASTTSIQALGLQQIEWTMAELAQLAEQDHSALTQAHVASRLLMAEIQELARKIGGVDPALPSRSGCPVNPLRRPEAQVPCTIRAVSGSLALAIDAEE